MRGHKQCRGFSMVELLTALAIIGVISAIATPSFLSWRENYKIKAVAREVNSIMQRARTEAIKRNSQVVINFSTNGYSAFVDDGAGGGTADNKTQDGDEETLITENISGNISLTPSFATTGYTSKGLALTIGNIEINGDFTTRSYQVVLSGAGHTRIKKV